MAHLISHHDEWKLVLVHICVVEELIAPHTQSLQAVPVVECVAEQTDVRSSVERGA